MSDENNFIPCKIEKPVKLNIGSPSVEFNSGCSVIEVSLPVSNGCKIGFIKFKNNYVASLSIRLKLKNPNGEVSWETVLRNHILMPNPHLEQASQDNFTIVAGDQFTLQPDNVIGARLILRQPSPHWSIFSLEDIKFYLPSQNSTEKEYQEEEQAESVMMQGDNFPNDEISDMNVNISQLSAKVNKIVSITADQRKINSFRKTASSRFDVDGNYDLNLLSYT